MRRITMLRIIFLVSFLNICTPCLATENSDSNQPIDQLKLEKAVGQLLIVGFIGTSIDPQSEIVQAIKNYHIGGVILFDTNLLTRPPGKVRNIINPTQLQKLTNDLQNYAKKYDDYPLIISVDQEGGEVNRLPPDRGFSLGRNLSEQTLGKLNNPALVYDEAYRRGVLLKNLGINLDFAPVVALDINPHNPAIGALHRSFGSDPTKVTKLAAAAIKGYHAANIFCCIKHFPGLGSAAKNTDFNRVDVSKTWRKEELIPYQQLIANNNSCNLIMVTPLINRQLEPNGLPVILSKKVVTDLLRDQFHFTGVITSDDMDAKALRNYYSEDFVLKKAILAGINIFIFGGNNNIPPDVDTPQAFNTILKLAETDPVIRAKVYQSAQQILLLKKNIKN